MDIDNNILGQHSPNGIAPGRLNHDTSQSFVFENKYKFEIKQGSALRFDVDIESRKLKSIELIEPPNCWRIHRPVSAAVSNKILNAIELSGAGGMRGIAADVAGLIPASSLATN